MDSISFGSYFINEGMIIKIKYQSAIGEVNLTQGHNFNQKKEAAGTECQRENHSFKNLWVTEEEENCIKSAFVRSSALKGWKIVALKNSLTLHVVKFTPLLLQLLLQGFTLPLQARQSFSLLELLTGHLDPERTAPAPGAGCRVGRVGSRVPGSKWRETRWSAESKDGEPPPPLADE